MSRAPQQAWTDPLARPGIRFPRSRKIAPTALMCALRYHFVMKRGVLAAAGVSDEEATHLRLRELFIGGGVTAGLACAYIQGRRGPWIRASTFRHLFSLWANFLILADAASDSRELGRESSAALLRTCRSEILQPMGWTEEALKSLAGGLDSFGPETQNAGENLEAGRASRFAQASIALAREFGSTAASCLQSTASRQLIRSNSELFLTRLASLLRGQLESLNQFLLEDRYDWAWYRSQVLDAKFANILLGPLVLLARTEIEVARRIDVEKGLLLVNRLYLHRQIMDDLLDVRSDCEDGILGAPAYLLMRLATAAEPSEPAPLQPSPGLEDLSLVLARRIAARGPQATAQEKERARFFKTLWSQDRAAAASQLIGSETVRELLAVLEDPKRTRPITAELDALLRDAPDLVDVIGLYYHLCARSFRRLKSELGRA
jgi:hypothetical protein